MESRLAEMSAEESACKLPEHDLALLKRYGSFFWFFFHSLQQNSQEDFALFFSVGVKMARDTRMRHWVRWVVYFHSVTTTGSLLRHMDSISLKNVDFFFLPERWFYNSILMRSDFQAYGTIELRNSEIPLPGFGSLPAGRIKSASQSFKLQVKIGSSQMLKLCSEVVLKQSQ